MFIICKNSNSWSTNSIFCILILTLNSAAYSFSDSECYECFENPLNDNHIRCEVLMKDPNFKMESNRGFYDDEGDSLWSDEVWDDDDLEEDGIKYSKGYSTSTYQVGSPCEFVAERVLEFVDSQDEFAFMDLDLEESKKKREHLKSSISSIQFQKREKIDMVIAEITMRDTSDVFTFVLSDPEFNFLDISYDSWYYVAL